MAVAGAGRANEVRKVRYTERRAQQRDRDKETLHKLPCEAERHHVREGFSVGDACKWGTRSQMVHLKPPEKHPIHSAKETPS